MEESFLPQTLDITKVYEQKLHNGLYIVSTPIGNIFDITIRAIAILKQSRCILAEDARIAKKLLSFYDISVPVISCNNYTELEESALKQCQKGGIVSLVSDAGTPLISDPGYKLINWCIDHNIDVYPIPGACSPICALCVSGLPTDEFHFAGFLPQKSRARIKRLQDLAFVNSTLIFFESPNRVIDSLQDMLSVFGDRGAYIGRELTKLFEEHRRGKISSLIHYFMEHQPIGEFVIAVDKGEIKKEITDEELKNTLSKMMKTMSLKDAVNAAKVRYNIQKNKIYEIAITIKEGA